MAEVEELLDGVAVRLPDAETIRAKGQRKRTRRRATSVAFTAVVVAAGVWAVLPSATAGQEREESTVATAPDNPYLKDGVIQIWSADEVPLYEKWHWTPSENPGEDVPARTLSGPLPKVGFGNACPRSFESERGKEPDQTDYSRLYKGKGAAKARHRIAEYNDTATARGELNVLRDELKACGLRPSAEKATDGAAGHDVWRGTMEGGRTMRVYLERWGPWVSMAEVLDGTGK